MGEYAGESVAKKVARVRLYKRVKQMLDAYGRDLTDIRVLFLAGPDGTEVGCLKHILRVRPEHAVGVDRDAEACRNLAKKWPGVNVIHGDLIEKSWNIIQLSHSERAFDFVHLDLMGNMSQMTKKIYGLYGCMCAEGGIAALTYLRGREFGGSKEMLERVKSHTLKRMKNASGRWEKSLAKIIEPDPGRASTHNALLEAYSSSFGSFLQQMRDGVESPINPLDLPPNDARELMQEAPWWYVPISTYSYVGESSPMGVVASQRIDPKRAEGGLWRDMFEQKSRHSSSVIKRDAMLELLAEADSLSKSFTKEEVAEILDVRPGTLAAWKAHRTMGTYAN